MGKLERFCFIFNHLLVVAGVLALSVLIAMGIIR